MASTIAFLTGLGTANYEEEAYEYEGNRYVTRFAPVATVALAFGPAERANMQVGVITTAQAKGKWFAEIEAEMRDLGVGTIRCAEIPEVPAGNEIETVLPVLLDAVPAVAEPAVAIDITYGFRHLPFLYVAALTYLVGLRAVEFRGIYYAAREIVQHDSTHPIVDLRHFWELIQWYHAVAAVHDTGRARPLSSVFRDQSRHHFSPDRPPSPQAKWLAKIRDAAEKLSVPLACGLPLEAGICAHALLKTLDSNTTDHAKAASLAAQHLATLVRPWSVSVAARVKTEVRLTKEELLRQWNFARWLFEHEDYTNCLEALREWLVNLVLYRQGEHEQWLSYEKKRKPAERFLSAASYRIRIGSGGLSDTHRVLATLWDEISERRNQLAHAGMRKDETRIAHDSIRKLIDQAEDMLDRLDALEINFQAMGGTLLVNALGRSPGSLYSALLHVRPQRLMVLGSQESLERLDETLRAADLTSIETVRVILEDPYRGFRQARDIIPLCRPHLIAADTVVVNLTGGTTAMQYIAERIADEARRLGQPVKKLAVFDERPAEEQRSNPFHLGGIEWIEGEQGTEPPSPRCGSG
ncbi:MAG: hypothetical protein KatS3mg077_0576 [Candidatus Binatia bacterium]|nr:MAG: hypothetical protein KatS3mg077_0576 [Candidatus Binatia bacterium]